MPSSSLLILSFNIYYYKKLFFFSFFLYYCFVLISPLSEILHLLQSYLLLLPALVFHYEFWVMIEHRVLAFGQWCKVREHGPGMDVSWCAAHELVGLLYHCSNIHVVTMVEEILQKRRDRKVHYVSKFVFSWIRLDEKK